MYLAAPRVQQISLKHKTEESPKRLQALAKHKQNSTRAKPDMPTRKRCVAGTGRQKSAQVCNKSDDIDGCSNAFGAMFLAGAGGECLVWFRTSGRRGLLATPPTTATTGGLIVTTTFAYHRDTEATSDQDLQCKDFIRKPLPQH